ncbi:hypothetical protein J5F27_08760 [Schleiferilactobacillus harbinensis]|uniref:Uncharacterized protein n=1 Tax=Schleiferilactobacillus harbinensis TaxID=304207 RepID=A0A5P8M1X2_9LACO|nr:hypothetical protein [Schleiferilactobacillus harbinensis]MBO3092015.1 hypothetical protein [Schleiferilactobacillus harbinensis]QFR22500.1 hypothetical protein D1010_03055 [Schleiferilactobacillus harbinensis]
MQNYKSLKGLTHTDTEELRDYIEANSNVKHVYMNKAMERLQEINRAKSPARRSNDAELDHQAEMMYANFIYDVHDKIVASTNLTGSDSYEQWIKTIQRNEILEGLEESIVGSDY